MSTDLSFTLAKPKPEAREPLYTTCTKCEHVWAAAYLPMDLNPLCKLMKGLCCPMCGATSKHIGLSDTPPPDAPRQVAVPPQTREKWPGLEKWLASGARGASSNAIVQKLTGIHTGEPCAYPHDPADLRRCRLLLEAVPALAEWLPRMSEVGPEWLALVTNWNRLCSVMDEETPMWRDGHWGGATRTYEIMRELIDGARKA